MMEIQLKEVLKRELKGRNESVNSVASACHIPPATLHGWVQGVLPSAKNIHFLKVLSEYLGITITTLLFNVKDETAGGTILYSSTFVDENRRYRLIIEKLPK